MRIRWAALGLWLWSQVTWACPEPIVTLVLSYSVSPYTEVAAHLKLGLEAQGIPIAAYPASCPKLYLALGSKAAKEIRRRDRQTPIVLALALDADAIAEVAPATGVWLMHPLATQWKYLRKLLPEVSRLSVLYAPHFQAQALELSALAQRDRVKLELIAVNEARELAYLAARLTGSAAIFFLGDSRVFSLNAVQPLLVASYARRIPVVGLSAQWVQRGAAYALDWDWQDLAAQIAELIAALWSGTPLDHLPPQPPRTAKLIINSTLWPTLSERGGGP